jgi:hypothetical protein
MAVIGVDLLQNGAPVSSVVTVKTVAVEVQNTATSYTVNNISQSAVEVAVPVYLSNVVVSPTEPAFPYEGQIWIDVS